MDQVSVHSLGSTPQSQILVMNCVFVSLNLAGGAASHLNSPPEAHEGLFPQIVFTNIKSADCQLSSWLIYTYV